jgi:hypothetical protein
MSPPLDYTMVQVPGVLNANYRAGQILGWTFTPHAGYFGPKAVVFDGPPRTEQIVQLPGKKQFSPFVH